MNRPLLVVARRVRAFARPRGRPDPASPDSVLIVRGRVAAVGIRARLERMARRARRIELPGATLTPGLADAHLHPVEWAFALRAVSLDAARSAVEAAAEVGRHAAEVRRRVARPDDGGGPDGSEPAPPERTGARGWLRGWGWNPHVWPDAPSRALLDATVPDRPVALTSHDLHALWVNSAALAAAGVGSDTPDPDGGVIVRDAAGEPTGILLENATRLVLDRIPAPTPADRDLALAEAQARLHAYGITAVHSVEPESLAAFESLRAAGRLRLRVLQHLPLARLDEAIAIGLRSGFGGEWIRIGGIKMFLDGALGSRTAWMREPYAGTSDRGVQVLPEAEFRDAVRRAAAAGLASTVHAIGDAAVGLALDVLSDPATTVPALPHRIEHVQLCPPERTADAARAGIVCSVQPVHLMTDWKPAERHWGRARCRGAYAFRALREGRSLAEDGGAGPAAERFATLAFGSDGPVEPVDPRLGLFAAVARQDLDGEPERGWFPDERLSVAEAFRAYTRGPARAARWSALGRLAPGAHADLVAWDRDPLAVPPAELLDLRCVATFVAGEPVAREVPAGETRAP